MTVRIAALRERPDESRVALTPIVTAMLVSRGLEVNIETEAGLGAGFTDDDYSAAGATIVDADAAYECDIVACVDAPGLSISM